MTGTGWFLSEVDLTNHSTLFVSQNGHIIPIPLYGGTTYPDGGVRTSVAESATVATIRGFKRRCSRISQRRSARSSS